MHGRSTSTRGKGTRALNIRLCGLSKFTCFGVWVKVGVHLEAHGTWELLITGLITLLIPGVAPISPFRRIISRVIIPVISS